jgi:hypothetical protein
VEQGTTPSPEEEKNNLLSSIQQSKTKHGGKRIEKNVDLLRGSLQGSCDFPHCRQRRNDTGNEEDKTRTFSEGSLWR